MKDAILGIIGLAIVALLAFNVYQNHYRLHRPLVTTVYQAVTLVNGSVFYGRIQHLGSDHPVLRDPFTVRSEADPSTGHLRHVLLRRADDVNGADHLIIPIGAIALVEPVRPDSTIGRLIEQRGLAPRR